ncbi:CPBP family intramembrane glutamic endopeptidase [Pediococcus siamensis]|uniref:CPBP family intramembrane glutamic endopeptidase n=1 Tax=Pediococcus siamensis TaxID=381829 RepID=UPI00399F9087
MPSFGFSKSASWFVTAFLIVFSVWYVIWNGFGDGNKLADVLTSYSFSMAKINLKMIFASLETIVEEWIFRFGILTLLLRAFKNHHQLEWAVGLNGLLFGLWHVTNGFAGQSWSATFEQMLSAGAAGMLFAAIYLYTRNFAFPVLFHFFNNFLGLSSSANMVMSAPTSLDWVTTFGQVVVFSAIVWFLLSGKRKQAMQATLSY